MVRRPSHDNLDNFNHPKRLHIHCHRTVETCTALALSSGLGQLKWIKYRQRPRSLAEMQIFDDASRKSFVGSLLVATGRGGFFAAFGVGTILLTLVMGPFTQQVMKYPVQSLPAGEQGVVLSAMGYTEWSGAGSYDALATLPMKAAVYDALYGFSANVSLKDPYSFCPTGNCTWEPFLSLAVCSECTDISNLLLNTSCALSKAGTQSCVYYLPDYNNFTLNLWGQDLNAMNSTCFNPVDVGYLQPDPIVNFTMINSTSTAQEGPVVEATECKLRFCLQNISTAVVDGEFQQNVSQAFPKLSLTRRTNLTYERDYESWEFIAPDNTTYVVSSLSWSTLVNFLNIFTGHRSSLYTPPFSSDPIQALYASDNVTALMESVATSMTNRFREASSMWPGVPSTTTVLGKVYTTEPHFAVAWGWLILPTAAVGLTWIFLLAIMYKSWYCGAKIWKTSTLPLIFHGLSDETRMNLGHCETIDAMEKKAKGIAVQLRDADGQRASMLDHDSEYTQVLIAKMKKRSSTNLLGGKRRSRSSTLDLEGA